MFYSLFWCFSFIFLSAYSCTFHIVSSVGFCNCAHFFSVFRFCFFLRPAFFCIEKNYFDVVSIWLYKTLWCGKHVNFADGSINLSSFILHMTPFISQGNEVRSCGRILGNFIKETNSFRTFSVLFAILFLLIFTISAFFVQWQGGNWPKWFHFWQFSAVHIWMVQ